MTELSNQRSRKNGTRALVLGLVLLGFVLIVVVQFWPGWGILPLDEVPLLFWVMYVPVALGWLSMAIYNVVPPVPVYVEKTRTTNIVLLVVGAILVGQNLFAQTWTGTRLLEITIGVLLLFQSASSLLLVYREKRRRKAQAPST